MKKELKKVGINDIKPYEHNPRRNDGAVDAVAESILQCEYIAPIIVDEHSVILAGHTRYKALKQLGYNTIDIMVVSGLSSDQKKKYRLLDNKTNELADWDFKMLEAELADLDFGGFDFGFDTAIDDYIDQHEQNKAEEQFADANILNLERAQFAGVGEFDIPELEPVYELPEIEEWIGFNYVLTEQNPEHKGVHFFLNDYQFERVWNNPDKYLDKLSQFAVVATPDFSPYGDMPFCLQLFNHYRKHWCGAYWQVNGITVIPTIRAATDPRSKRFYLDGEPEGGIVLISSMWTETDEEIEIFKDEYNTMLDKLKPSKIFLYGDVLPGMKGNIERIPTFCEKRWG